MTIETREQYDAALEEVQGLMLLKPAPDSPDGKRLNELADRMVAYAKKHNGEAVDKPPEPALMVLFVPTDDEAGFMVCWYQLPEVAGTIGLPPWVRMIGVEENGMTFVPAILDGISPQATVLLASLNDAAVVMYEGHAYVDSVWLAKQCDAQTSAQILEVASTVRDRHNDLHPERNVKDANMENLMWWAYLHTDGTVHAKRWAGDPKDYTTDVKGNTFVKTVMEPYAATDRADAIRQACEFFQVRAPNPNAEKEPKP